MKTGMSQRAAAMLRDVSIEIIQRCFNHCLHCSSCSTEQSPEILPLSVLVPLIDGLFELRVDKICLSGGEPLLHPDVVEIVREIAAHQVRADIYTCGVVPQDGISAAVSEEMLYSLKDAGLNTLIFNLPSLREETYDFITQSRGHLPLVLESIRHAAACGISAEIHFVPMKPNVSEAAQVVRFAQREGIRQVNFLKLMPHGRALEKIGQILPDDEELAALRDQLLHLDSGGTSIRIGLPLLEGDQSPPCHAVREKLYIRFDGRVFGCEAFKYLTFRDERNAEILPDSIRERNIQSIYRRSPYLERSLDLVSTYQGVRCGCENCPVQKYIKNRSVCDELFHS